MRLGGAIVLVVTACTVVGCGASAKSQVRAKVRQFASATARKDYRTICHDVLAPALVAHLTSNHIPCERAMQLALGGVQHPTLSIGPITVKGKVASVYTLTVAQGQQASLDVLQLSDTSDGWRVTSLHSPLPR